MVATSRGLRVLDSEANSVVGYRPHSRVESSRVLAYRGKTVTVAFEGCTIFRLNCCRLTDLVKRACVAF